MHSPALRDRRHVLFERHPVVSAREHQRRNPGTIESESSFGEPQEAFDDRLVMGCVVDHEPIQGGLVGEHHLGRGAIGHLRKSHLELAKTIEV